MERIKTFDEIKEVVSKCSFGDWQINVKRKKDTVYLQISATTIDLTDESETYSWHGRKWLISPWMTDSEIIQTAFLAVKTAVEHEAREMFKFDGVAIFGPHMDLKLLTDVAEAPLDVRGNQ